MTIRQSYALFNKRRVNWALLCPRRRNAGKRSFHESPPFDLIAAFLRASHGHGRRRKQWIQRQDVRKPVGIEWVVIERVFHAAIIKPARVRKAMTRTALI